MDTTFFQIKDPAEIQVCLSEAQSRLEMGVCTITVMYVEIMFNRVPSIYIY